MASKSVTVSVNGHEYTMRDEDGRLLVTEDGTFWSEARIEDGRVMPGLLCWFIADEYASMWTALTAAWMA